MQQSKTFDLPTDSSYIVERYVNGSECDLSASPRSTEVWCMKQDSAAVHDCSIGGVVGVGTSWPKLFPFSDGQIHFICGDMAEAGIDSIQEIESCKYVITLSVPQLCPEQSGEAPSQAQEIACFPYHEPDVADST